MTLSFNSRVNCHSVKSTYYRSQIMFGVCILTNSLLFIPSEFKYLSEESNSAFMSLRALLRPTFTKGNAFAQLGAIGSKMKINRPFQNAR